MSKSNYLESQVIQAIFGSGSLTPGSNLYVALHTADPGEAGNQSTSEATFGNYARQAVAVPGGWTSGVDQTENSGQIAFPEATGGSETVTHFSVGDAASGAGNIFYFAELAQPVAVIAGVTVRIGAGNLVITED